ncbi:unnamed protein product [Haemonchus placei]|uniref:1,4-dihydroxy-2-naphthoate polyprenyltransferase n=1 Tax=Haemonchus placei TaxID=6290 RepID=A0A0N4X5J3_HAEPC|nr:unnamed protein product [Haemonchus placei]
MVQEDVNLSTALPSAPATKKGPHDPRIARFTASVLVLITIGLVQLIGQSMAVHGPVIVAQLLFLFFTAFTHEVGFGGIIQKDLLLQGTEMRGRNERHLPI